MSYKVVSYLFTVYSQKYSRAPIFKDFDVFCSALKILPFVRKLMNDALYNLLL